MTERAFSSGAHSSSLLFALLVFALAGFITFTTGCSTSKPPAQTGFGGNTTVTVLLSSTANDQFSAFGLTINSLSLTNRLGNTVSLLTNPQGAEFMHLNGLSEPLVSASIPQGIYTSATATIGYAYFTCVTDIPPAGSDPGNLVLATYAYGATPDSQVSVTLPSAITVTGSNMGLVLDLAVSQSANIGSCYVPNGGLNPYAINPTFSMEPLSAGKGGQGYPESNLIAEVSSLDNASGSIDVTLADGQQLSVATNNSTAFQGISGLSALATGMIINFDIVIQSDGTQLATRIAVPDTNTIDLSVLAGTVIQTGPSDPFGNGPTALFFGSQQQGFFSENEEAAEAMPFILSATNFQISDTVSHLSTLPFVPSFNNTTLVNGESAYVTTHAPQPFDPDYPAASTVTLEPQTIDGTITGSSNAGGFTAYAIALAAYDLFPTLAVEPVQTAVLTNANEMFVYVDTNTKQLNSNPLVTGSAGRFRGLVFNDNGILRMDCVQVNDGVSVTAAAAPTGEAANVRIERNFRKSGQIMHALTVKWPAD
ncbi:MAG TPA: hypothetical protein VFA90_01665 [Terriglobales bacterium]|nr:hypothetical protein [Terriglobales bacterium]